MSYMKYEDQLTKMVEERNAFEIECITLKTVTLELTKSISTTKRSNRYIKKQSKRVLGELNALEARVKYLESDKYINGLKADAAKDYVDLIIQDDNKNMALGGFLGLMLEVYIKELRNK